MNKFYIKYIPFLFVFFLESCSYKPIFSEKNYNFEINKVDYIGERQINNIIKNKLNLIKKSESLEKKEYNLTINSSKEKIIVSKDSKGDPLKFEIIISTEYIVESNNSLLLSKKIKRNNIYNNSTDKFKLEQNEKIIIENLTEKIGEVIISSIINLDDN